MEELTLRYYLRIFSIPLLLLLIFIFFYIYSTLNKKNFIETNHILIKKNENISSIINNYFTSINNLEKIIFNLYFKINYYLNSYYFHYGNFHTYENISYIDFLKLISEPSNILNKITIIEGWSKKDLNQELKKYFKNYETINYHDIIADTYFIEQNEIFENFHKKLKKTKKNYLKNLKKNIFFKNYSEKDLFIIGSLLEKEGLGYLDKKLISSVIFNRLNQRMKLQIDATVIFALTNGQNKLNRKLTYNDLKIENEFNTYIINGLPPDPISYVGKNTLNLILENHSSDFLFYFFNKSLNKHIFSLNYDEHKKKLNEYRKK